MNIYLYSDESGVLDKHHNDFYIFAGLLFLSKEERDNCSRKYLAAENTIRKIEHKFRKSEIKANTITNKSKNKLFRSLNQVHKFGIVIRQKEILDKIFQSKKSKQRYLDWAFKMAVKAKFESLIASGEIIPEEVKQLYFFVDEHTTATDGVYELRESLEEEFRYGMFGCNYTTFFPPIFPQLLEVQLKHCDSKSNILIRSADIVANKLFFMAAKNDFSGIDNRNFCVKQLP